MTSPASCPYSDCDLHKRYAQNFCTSDYEDCCIYQVWREQESKLKEIVGMDTKTWEKDIKIIKIANFPAIQIIPREEGEYYDG